MVKIIWVFLSENFQFLEVKFSIYLNRHVFVMSLSMIHVRQEASSKNSRFYAPVVFLLTVQRRSLCCSSLFVRRWFHSYNVASTSMQRHDVASTFKRRCINVICPLGCDVCFVICPSFWFLGKAVLSECGISWVSLLIFLRKISVCVSIRLK